MATVSVEEREGKQITSILRINVTIFSFSGDWGENSIWSPVGIFTPITRKRKYNNIIRTKEFRYLRFHC